MTRRRRADELTHDDLFQLPDGGWGEVLGVLRPPGVGGLDRVVVRYRRAEDPPGDGRITRLSADDTLVVNTPDATVAAAAE